ncbi:MAG: RNA polymerase sigma factor [Pseudomonadota bacterium]
MSSPDALPLNPLISERALRQLHEEAWRWAALQTGAVGDDADEVMQMVYEQVIDGRARYRGEAALRTWLFSVVRITAARLRRRRWLDWQRLQRYVTLSSSDDEYADVAATGGIETGAIELDSAGLEAGLKQLSPRQRDLVYLCVYREFTIEQAARILGVGIGSARTHYQRAKVMLRRHLESRDGH